MRSGAIYKVSCTVNGYFLFGSSVQFEKRIGNYKSDLERNDYNNKFLQRCYNKHGWNSLEFEIVQENIPEDILEFVEDVWIGSQGGRIEDKLGGMNMRDASRVRHTQETRNKMSMARIGKKDTLETINKRLRTRKENGKIRTKEFRAKLSSKMIGIPNIRVSKRVYQFSKNGNFMKSYTSIKEAQEITGVERSMISRCCNGELRGAGNFIWSFNNIFPKDTRSSYRKEKDLLQSNVYFLYKNSKLRTDREKATEISILLNIGFYTIRGIISRMKKQELKEIYG